MLNVPRDDFLLLTISSPSGAGRTTLCNRLCHDFPDLHFSVSHTTCKPRASEIDGREYHFVDPETFKKMVEQHAFVEWAKVHEASYGTSLADVEHGKLKKNGVLFDINSQRARQLKSTLPETVGVFILPPSLAELGRRLRARGTADEASVRRRIQAAKGEIEHYGLFDYVLINDDVERAHDQLRAIVLAERARRQRRARLCEQMLGVLAPAVKNPTGSSMRWRA